MFHRTLLDPQLSPHFATPFPTFALGSSTSHSLLHPSVSPSTATLQGGLCFGRVAEQSLLAGYEPKSLIEVSSEHTPINLPSSKGSPDTNLDDLATSVDASVKHDTTDVGRVGFTTVFSGARSKCCPIIQAWRDPGGTFLFSDHVFKRGEIQAGR